MVGAWRHLLSKNLKHIERLSWLILVVLSKELLVSLCCFWIAFLLSLTVARVTATWSHVELRRCIDYNEIVLAGVIIHVFLNIVVCLLDIIKLLLLVIIVIYRCMIIVVILYFDILSILSCLGALCLMFYWRISHLILTSHLRAQIWALWRWSKDFVVSDEKVVEIILLFKCLRIKFLRLWSLALFI